jgi:aminobenzoyl-glutamate utilization protein B
MSIGHKGMIYASKAMAMTMSDLFESPDLVKKVKAEYLERKGNEVYKAIIPEGPPPINQN